MTRRVTLPQRLLAGVIALGALTVLALAAWMEPDGQGHSTHEQIGLPPCQWAQTFDAPCMTCGMTTSFAHAADGDLLGSLLTQPMGMLLAVGTATGFWMALHVALTGSRLGAVAGALLRPRALWTIAGLAALAWAYKFVTWESLHG